MKLHTINTGRFKLDGGAMFGVVPKSIWQRTNPADSNNMCSWALRCLLIEDGDRLTLIDTGMGSKQNDKFFGYYYLHGNESLDFSLNELGFNRKDITDVFLTHLHFDHCGGAIELNKNTGSIHPTFETAKYWSNKDHWQWAINPNPREKASFLKENINPIEASGQLNFLGLPTNNFMDTSDLGFSILFADGHTDKQMIPHIQYKGHTLVFCADLLPSTGHIPLPYVMGYDTRPLLTIKEKAKFLNTAADNKYVLFLEHDNYTECCTVKNTEKGVRLDEKFNLSEL
jgi:glyoxylase-like metal-dependent hydrolase (beta-lactamase superfamily II)